MTHDNTLDTDINVGRKFISYDGNHLITARLDGSIFIQFNDGTRYGCGYFHDPYKNSLEDVRPTSIGFKTIAVKKDTLILTKNTGHLYLGKFNLYDIKNIEKIDDTFNIGNPTITWICKENPYKTEIETYRNIGFIDNDNIMIVSEVHNSDAKIYIFNQKTDTWIVINDMSDTDIFNWVDNPMMYFLFYGNTPTGLLDSTPSIESNTLDILGSTPSIESHTLDILGSKLDLERNTPTVLLASAKSDKNLIIITIDNNQIQKKTFNFPDITNLACSRQTKKLSKFNNTTKTLDVMLYKDFFENNIIWESHTITFIDDKEIYTDHNMTNNAYILTTNKNIYVKLFTSDDWKTINFTSKDTYIINNSDDTFYDSSSTFWNNILVDNNSIVITSLCGETYYMKILENETGFETGFKFSQSQLPMIFGNDELFNIIFQNLYFTDRINKKYKIKYFSGNKKN